MGFGTGLNALLTWIAAENSNKQVGYVSVEKYPLPVELVQGLGYSNNTNYAEKFPALHRADWEKPVQMSANFTLTKLCSDLDEIELKPEFDLVYYDAFGPRVQPNMWTTQKLEIVYNLMKPGGRMVTYCAQGQFRRNLKEVGFVWNPAPGPPGKREMTIAEKAV